MRYNIVQVDFDGTIVEHAFPNIGEPLPEAFDVLKELQYLGCKLILWTCREDYGKNKYLSDAVEFCKKNGVEFDAINETILDGEWRPDDCLKRKPYEFFKI